MDSNGRQQRQTDAGFQAGQQSTYFATSSDRFEDTSVLAASPAARGYGHYVVGTVSSEGSVPAGGGGGAQFVAPGAATLQYATEYSPTHQRPPQAQRQQQQQHFQQQPQHLPQQYPQYTGNVLYNVPPQHQTTPQSPYEPVQPYPPRPSAVAEGLSTQFDVAQQYYVPGEPVDSVSQPTTAIGAQQVMQYPSVQYNAPHQSPVGREMLPPAFAVSTGPPAGVSILSQIPSSQGETGNLTGSAAYAQSQSQQQQPSYAPRAAQEQDPMPQPPDANSSAYDAHLRQTFQLVHEGRLADAADSLLEISRWLLTNVEALGLVRDDETMHAHRLKQWEEFNTCWLATLQKQKEATIDLLRRPSGSSPSQRQLQQLEPALIRPDFLESMGRELVQLCDGLEKHGLVDYQIGVWEEEIITLLSACLDLIEKLAPSAQGTARQTDGQRDVPSGQ